MSGWICAGLAVAALVGWTVYRGSFYRRLFADGHFVEVARGIARIKPAAIDHVIVSEEDAVTSGDDPRVLITSRGLALCYTVAQYEGEGRFVHHYSISLSGGHTAHAAGASFILFTAKLLGIPFDSLALGVGRSTVHHAEFRLAPAEHEEFARRPVLEISPEEITAFRRESIVAHDRLQWQRLEADPG
jgi:hypothetical protein